MSSDSSDISPRNPPQVKPWVRRTVKAAGVVVPETPDGEKRLGWWGVEMARFLRFALVPKVSEALWERIGVAKLCFGGCRVSMGMAHEVVVRW